MRRAVCAGISLVVLASVAASCSWAVERELSGVRLGETAMDLLDRPGYGEPDFVGPLGTLTVAVEEPQGAAASRAGAQTRSGPSGPTAGRAGGGRGMRGGGGGARGGMRGGGRRGGGMRGGGMAAATGARAVTGAAGARDERPGMYWYYKRPGNATLVLSLDPEGEVLAITLSGNAPSAQGVTNRGIGLTSNYMQIIAQYSYPDQTVSAGTALELTYVDHGVRFTLDSMRVREIAIGAHIAAGAEAAPAAPELAPPPAGMSIEELRGYL